jgi:hypothetical protein
MQRTITASWQWSARSSSYGYGLLALVTLAMFAETLWSDRLFVSSRYGDLATQFVDWRAFGFGELRAGRLPLWNPYLFGGSPYLGGFQAALLYPPNILFLLLPLNLAVNWSIALHVFLGGAFTYRWARRRELHPLACLVGAAMFMFGAAHWLHIYAGHLSNLCTLVWTPLIISALDELMDAPSTRAALLGMFAAAMQILAGHPQYVFYTAVAAAIYVGLNFGRVVRKGAFAAGLGAMFVGAVGLSAIQLFTGLQVSREMVRRALPFEYAAQFSFAPENLLTLFVPTLLGDQKATPYWGRGYLWEMSLYVGVAGLVLVMLGALSREPAKRRFSGTMAVLLVVLALGAHTPLFSVLYAWVPGFNQFRGSAKLVLPASMFLSMLAAIGAQRLLTTGRLPRAFIFGTAGLGAVMAAAALAISTGTHGWWTLAMRAARDSGEALLDPRAYVDPLFVAGAARTATHGLLISAAILLAVSTLLALRDRRRWVPWAIPVVAIVELCLYARTSFITSDLDRPEMARVRDVINTHPGDYRVLNLINPNVSLGLRVPDVWGHDPGVISRYAELVAATQHIAPDRVTDDLQFTQDHPLLDLLRCRFIFHLKNGQFTTVERPRYLPRVLLVSQARVLGTRDEILSALTDRTFDPRAEVILESAPDPAPQPSSEPGHAEVVESTANSLTIRAIARSPSMLLITDAFASGWRVRPLRGGPQRAYHLVPANYALQGIALEPGEHLLRLEYRPSGFLLGAWTSGVFAPAFVAAVIAARRRRGQNP